jgi:hypothetical protein
MGIAGSAPRVATTSKNCSAGTYAARSNLAPLNRPVTSNLGLQMQLAADRLDETSLAELGLEARQLLVADDISTLSLRYGYALAFDLAPADAIRAEVASCLAEVGATGFVQTGWENPLVSYFKPNNNGLFALVECSAPTDSGASILIEIIVTWKGAEAHATLEQFSAAV